MLKNYFQSSWLYTTFLSRLVLFKKSTYFLVGISLFVNLIFIIINGLNIANNIKTYLILFYLFTSINSLLTIVFSTIKAINLFKDLKDEGIEILVFSKSISRKNIIFTKIGFLILNIVFWSLITYILNIIFYVVNIKNNNGINFFYLYAFFNYYFCGLIFASIAALIVSRWSNKVAMIIPISCFIPFLIAGGVANLYSTSKINQVAKYMNINYDKYDSNTILDVEKFYLNNHNDEVYLITKNLNNPQFSKRQNYFLKAAFDHAKNASTFFHVLSWLSVPYQLNNSFYKNDIDPFSVNSQHENYLDKYFNYHGLESKLYDYKLNKHPHLPQFNINENQKEYFVPGALKNTSQFPTLENRNLIYARENVDRFDVNFIEDDNLFSSTNDFVGELKWAVIRNTLESKVFNNFAKKFYDNFDEDIDKPQIIAAYNDVINEQSSINFSTIVDENSILFAKKINNYYVKNLVEKKIYFIVALMYYLYFNEERWNLLEKLLKNDKVINFYRPSSIRINVNNYAYDIGGIGSYELMKKVVNNKTLYRYQLQKSNNYVFQTAKEVYSIKRADQIVNKNYYWLIWILFSTILIISLALIYLKRDYK